MYLPWRERAFFETWIFHSLTWVETSSVSFSLLSRTWETYFLNLTLNNLNNPLFAYIFVVPRKNLPPLARARVFWKINLPFFSLIKISNVCLPLFLYSRQMFSQCDSYQLEEHFITQFLVGSRKKRKLFC